MFNEFESNFFPQKHKISRDFSEGDRFIERVKALSTVELKTVKDKDIVLLVGPTGSGKSTLLNMLAGSSFTCKKNNCDEWEIDANPQVATIGHTLSETFVPNYWKDHLGNIFYDCPGFEDTRGEDYDIAKSYFLKTIGDHAQSMKVLLVGDIHTLSAMRGGSFGKVVEQVKSFIPGFDMLTDSELIITKALYSKKPSHISNILETKMGYVYPETKITILYEPDEVSGAFPYLNLYEIINKAPSIAKKCDLPLSSSAKVKVVQLTGEFNQEIKDIVDDISEKFNFYYLYLIQNKLEDSDSEISALYNTFKDVENLIKKTYTAQDFIPNLEKAGKKLSSFEKNEILLTLEDLLPILHRKIENLHFLQTVSNEEQHLIPYWIAGFNFDYAPLKKSNNLSKFKSLEAFNNFLINKNINPQKSIKAQVHKILNNPYNFFTNYQGDKKCSGKVKYSGEVSYHGSQPYSGKVSYSGEKSYSGTAYYSGEKSYSGSVSVPNCTHDRGFFNIPCLLCSHHQRDVSYSGKVEYDGSVPYSGTVRYNGSVPYSGTIAYNGSVPYSGEVDYSVTVPYSGSHEVTCQNHHTCSCQDLASMVFSAKELYEDIEYYKGIIGLQNQRLNKLQPINEPQLNISNFVNSFSLKGEHLGDVASSEAQIKDKIHQILKDHHSFEAKYEGQKIYLIQKPYSGGVSYYGNQPYSGTASYYDNIPYSGTIHYYAGTVACNGSVPYTGAVAYNGSVPYAGEVNYSVTVPYSGSHKVTCQQDHHGCDSCNTWDLLASNLKVLLEEKENYINIIKKQNEELKF
ncbi:MAG: ATP-binding cassette domain-containing protein [Neisseriaceae bacterium]|nr:MAG: ATP-binding cassette domain-containing protein [Neisseriaceae bacterium]